MTATVTATGVVDTSGPGRTSGPWTWVYGAGVRSCLRVPRTTLGGFDQVVRCHADSFDLAVQWRNQTQKCHVQADIFNRDQVAVANYMAVDAEVVRLLPVVGAALAVRPVAAGSELDGTFVPHQPPGLALDALDAVRPVDSQVIPERPEWQQYRVACPQQRAEHSALGAGSYLVSVHLTRLPVSPTDALSDQKAGP